MLKFIKITFPLVFLTVFNAMSQDWVKHSNFPFDYAFYTIQNFSKGDTIIVVGKDHASADHPFYISTDGGKNWSAETTKLSVNGNANFNSIIFLPINNLVLGFGSPTGTYSFNGVGNWTSFIKSAVGSYAEIGPGSLIYSDGMSEQIYKISSDGKTFTKTSVYFMFKTSFNSGNRLLLGANNGAVKYIDNGDVEGIKSAVFTPAITSAQSSTHFFKDKDGNLYATFTTGSASLYKSTDNGANWTQINPTGLESGKGCIPTDIMKDDNDNFYLSSSSCVNRMYKSTDKGVSFSPLNSGLPPDGNNFFFVKTAGKVLVTAFTFKTPVWDEENTGYYSVGKPTGIETSIGFKSNFTMIEKGSGEFQLFIDNFSTPLTLEVFNSLGQKVISEMIMKKEEFLNHNLTSGIYFVRLSGDNVGYSTKKLVVR